jgi:hypothetical protein
MPRSEPTPSRGPAVPTIVCINEAREDFGVDFDDLIAALQKFIDEHFVPVWGTPAKLVKGRKPRKRAWTLVFLDNARHAKLLGMHRAEYNGMPIAKVFVKATLDQKKLGHDEKVSVIASHELAEMLADPGYNLWAKGPRGAFYSYEVCDAVEEEHGFFIDGIPMSDFVYPAYFQMFQKSTQAQFDHLKRISEPFEILEGGYSQVREQGKLTIKFGSPAKKGRFVREDRRFHRSEYRR